MPPLSGVNTPILAGSQDFSESPTQLSAKHYRQWAENRGLNPAWVIANVRSVSTEEASSLLGYPAKSPGVWIEGANLSGQFRPDKPWRSPNQKGKAPKYRTASGVDYDAILVNHPADPTYWDDIEALKERCYKINDHPYLFITEGGAKAIAGCSNGLPTIALLGVEMGLTSSKTDPQGKRYLVPSLEKYASAGFGFIFAFDADAATNPNVNWAQLKLAHQIKKFNVPQYSITGLWSIEKGKGMDDYIHNNGADKFRREILAKAEMIEKWEQQFKSSIEETDKGKKKKPPKASRIAAQLAEKYKQQLAWHDGLNIWFRYSAEQEGKWSEESERSIFAVIQAELEVRPDLPEGFSSAFLRSVTDLLKNKLLVKRWDEQPQLIPLQDGVVNLKTGKLLPHNPGYHFLWQLPYRWQDSTVGCDPILAWLNETTLGDTQMVELLRAYLKAIVLGRVDLQRFLELIGPGGRGKGTFTRLAEALVGEENCETTTLEALETRFETIALVNKKLVTVTDSTRYGGEVSTLKALTGGDKVRIEEKNVSRRKTPSVKARCMVMISANEPIQSSDYTSGLGRRRLTVPFFNKVLPENKRDLDTEFAPYLPGLLQWVLAMPNQQMEQLLKNTTANVSAIAQYRLEMILDTNPLAEWFDAAIVLNPNAKTYVGNLNDERKLYRSYHNYVLSVGNSPISSRRFSNLLQDLAVNQLGLNHITKKRDRGGAYFSGIALRVNDYKPRPITELMASDQTTVTDKSVKCDASVTAETRMGDGCDECDALIETIHEELDHQLLCDVDQITSPGFSDQSVTNNTILHPQAFEESPNLSEVTDLSVTEPDYSSFPHLTCDTVESKRNQAQSIKRQLLDANNKEELTAVKNQWNSRFVWVWLNLLTQIEKGRISAIAKTEQLNLFTPSPTPSPAPNGTVNNGSGEKLAQSDKDVENVGEVGKTYLVHQDVDGCIEWVKAVLIDVPNPPLSTGWIFMSNSGQQFPVFDRDSFKESNSNDGQDIALS